MEVTPEEVTNTVWSMSFEGKLKKLSVGMGRS